MREYTISQMIKMQAELNDVYKPDWRESLTPSDYALQIIDEMSELLRSGIEYKWWSDVPVEKYDQWNAKVETIDVWFFYLSLIQYYLEEEEVEKLDCSSMNLLESMKEYFEGKLPSFVKNGNKIEASSAVSIIIAVSDILTNGIDAETVQHFSSFLFSCSSMNGEEVSALYAAKYELNQFRISADYKSGKYAKVVDGIEDNQRLKSVVESFIRDERMTLDDVREAVKKVFFVEKI